MLHEARDGAHALASDLIEEFRAPLVEGLTVWLFNARVLKEGHFVRVPGAEAETRMVRLAPEAARTVVRQYEGWLDRLIEEQAIAYGQAVLGDGDGYRPYVMDY